MIWREGVDLAKLDPGSVFRLDRYNRLDWLASMGLSSSDYFALVANLRSLVLCFTYSFFYLHVRIPFLSILLTVYLFLTYREARPKRDRHFLLLF